MISTFERNRHFRKVSVKKTFTNVQEQKKAMSPRDSAYIPSSVKSPLNNSSCPIPQLQLYRKLTPPQMFSVSVPRIFEITGKASVVESLLSKVTGEISVFCNSVKKSNTCIGML